MSRYKPPLILINLIKISFNLLYHQFAWTYDCVAAIVSLGRWKNWVNSVIEFIEGDRVLEIGHGPGHLQTSLLAKGVFCVGIDESKQMSALANKRLRQIDIGIASSPKLINGVGQHLPLASASFDTVIATFPAPYIFEKETVSEIEHVLKPGGLVIILLAAWFTGNNLLDKSAGLIYRITGETPGTGYDFGRFTTAFNEAGLDAQIQWINLANNRLLLIVAKKKVKSSKPEIFDERK